MDSHLQGVSVEVLQTCSFQQLLYIKNSIDLVQWHLEDIARDPDIEPTRMVELKRQIDKLNQDRTNTVEMIDDFFMSLFPPTNTSPGAKMNTESPGWVVDRMSILEIKIFHMEEQLARTNAPKEHIVRCEEKLAILYRQREDLAKSFNELIQDYILGVKRMQVYRQIKMYNDPTLNPVLYLSGNNSTS